MINVHSVSHKNATCRSIREMNVIWIQLRTFQACENLFMGHIVHDGLMEKKNQKDAFPKGIYIELKRTSKIPTEFW